MRNGFGVVFITPLVIVYGVIFYNILLNNWLVIILFIFFVRFLFLLIVEKF